MADLFPTSHAALCRVALRWLRGSCRCSVVFSEHVSSAGIIPDAIGWCGQWSILVECKVSRADFAADRKKPIHADPDGWPGQERWYLTPPGLVTLAEVPEGWRLAEAHGERVRRVSPQALRHEQWPLNERRARAELPLLLSAVRRHQLGVQWLDDEAKFESIDRRGRRESSEVQPLSTAALVAELRRRGLEVAGG